MKVFGKQVAGTAFFVVACQLLVGEAFACSTIIVGKDASESGRVLVGHNEDDDGWLSVRYGLVPARTHASGSVLPAESGCARIPQVSKTEAFYWGEVRDPAGGPPNADVFLNARGVLLVSNNAGSCPPPDEEDSLTDGGLRYNLRRAVGERARSARDAVDIITNLVSTWGYAMPGRMYTVADVDEAWVVELVHGRRFVARRCPDDAVVVIPNCYTIRRLEPGDIASPGILRRAAADAGFDFAATFQGEGRMNRATDVYRFRHMYRLVTGRMFEQCPFSARPVRKVRSADLTAALSTHYEGTPDELTPKHGEPYRTGLPVCRDSTVSSTVCSFGASLEETELLLATGSPCKCGYRAFRPFGDGLPADLDESTTAVARLEAHVSPDPDRGGIDLPFLLDLLRQPTVSIDREANNRCVEFMRAYLERRRVHCHVIVNDKGRKALYAATMPGKRHDFVFVSHVDVVPVADPRQFEPFVSGDWLYGRGSCDTKGNVAVICQVLVNLVGKASVGAFFATDEDGKTEGGTPTPKASLEKGFVPRRMILVGDGAGEEPNQLFVAEKGHAQFVLRAHGKGGHSSRPWDLDNPIHKLIDGYSRVRAAWPQPVNPSDRWYDVLSPTMLQGSEAGNIIPDVAEMRLSLRFTESDGVARAADFLRKTSGLEVVEPTTYRPPVVSDPNDPLIGSLFRAMRRKWPKDGIRFGRMVAATDAVYYAHLRLPTVIYAVTGVGPHAPDERVSLRSLSEYADMLTEHLQNP